MLNCSSLFLDLLPKLAALFAQIAQHDCDLARQLRRSAASVALNLAEGNASTKGTRKARFESAYASLKETIAGLRVAAALGYIPPLDAALLDSLDYVAASTWRLMHPR